MSNGRGKERQAIGVCVCVCVIASIGEQAFMGNFCEGGDHGEGGDYREFVRVRDTSEYDRQ